MCSATSYTNLAVNGQMNACVNLFPSCLDLMRSEHFQSYSGSSLEKEKCIGKDIKKATSKDILEASNCVPSLIPAANGTVPNCNLCHIRKG